MSNQKFFRGLVNRSRKMDEIMSLFAELTDEIKADLKDGGKKLEKDSSDNENPMEQGRKRGKEDCNHKDDDRIIPENELFLEVLGKEILITMDADQYNMLGQTFRPIFCGKVVEVTNGFITLDPVIIKMSNAPFHRFPTPLSFAIERISNFTPFDCEIQFPIP